MKLRKILLFMFKKVFLVAGIVLFIVSLIMTLAFNIFLAPGTETNFLLEVNEPFGIWGQNGTLIDVAIYQPRSTPFTQVNYPARPVVVLQHGMACDKTYMKGAAYELNRRGFVAVSITAHGHGASSGEFTGWVFFYNECLATVQWLRENAARLNIDINRIGLAGHSMGAFTVTLAAIMDQELGNFWINSTVSIAGPFLNMTRGDPDPTRAMFSQMFNLINTPRALQFLYPQVSLLRDIPAAVAEGIVEGRVSDVRPYNYLNIIGTIDEGFSVMSAQEVVWTMGNSTLFGIPNFRSLPSGVTYGDFSNGTARKLQVVPWIDHIMEMHDSRVIGSMIDWFEESMNLKSEPNYPGALNILTITEPIRWSENILMGLAVILLLIPLTVYLGNWFKPKNAPNPTTAKEIPKKETFTLFGIYGAVLVGTSVPIFPLVLTFNLQYILATDFLASNLISLFGFIHGLLLIPITIALLLIERAKYKEKFADFGMAKESILPSLLYASILVLIFFIMANTITTNNYFSVFPYKIWGFLELFGYIFLFILMHEIYLRGLIQSKLSRYKGAKVWIFPGKELIYSSLITGIIQGLSFGVVAAMFVFYLMQDLLIALLVPIACVILFIPVNGFQCWLYRKSRNIFAPVLFSSLLLAWIFSVILPAISSGVSLAFIAV